MVQYHFQLTQSKLPGKSGCPSAGPVNRKFSIIEIGMQLSCDDHCTREMQAVWKAA